MLYQGETVPIWDAETGKDVSEEIYKKEEQHVDESIKKARHLKSMTKTQGWKILKQWLQEEHDRYLEALQNVTDLEIIRRLQEALKAHDNIHAYVQRMLLTGEQFEQQRTPRKEG